MRDLRETQNFIEQLKKNGDSSSLDMVDLSDEDFSDTEGSSDEERPSESSISRFLDFVENPSVGFVLLDYQP